MKNILTSTIVSTVVMFLLYNYAPLQYFALEQERGLGATITTINGSDTISSSRSVINTNFSNLNSSKAEISDVSGTTTLSSLSSVGTITTGTWNATRISVPYGGTGWASIASGTIMYGKGSGAIGTTTAGSNGQVLTLVGGTPNWQSGGVDAGLDYTWTGFHNFSYGLFATRASTTNATTTKLDITGTASSSAVNLLITGNASTSRLVISNDCVGCSLSDRYLSSTTAFSVSSGATTYFGHRSAKDAYASYTITLSAGGGPMLGNVIIPKNGANSVSQTIVPAGAGNGYCTYNFAWSGTDMVVTESAENIITCDITGTLYWYK